MGIQMGYYATAYESAKISEHPWLDGCFVSVAIWNLSNYEKLLINIIGILHIIEINLTGQNQPVCRQQ